MKNLRFENWMIQEALKKAKSLGCINNSITKGRGNLAGYLSEIALSEYLECENISCDEGLDKYDFDLIKNGVKIDVKTKRRTVDPRMFYEVSIAETSKHQKADIYAFTSITFREKRGSGRDRKYFGIKSIWLCGFLSKKKYFQAAKHLKAGDIDESNGFTVHSDMYNLPISDLSLNPQELLKD
jgi:hypothetical protein